MRSVVRHEGQIVSQGDCRNEKIRILDQLPLGSEVREELLSFIQSEPVDHDNSQLPPHALECLHLP